MIRRMSLITILCLGFALALIRSASADDTEIYGSSNQYQPNVLIHIDNSASMSDSVLDGPPYDQNTSYTVLNKCKTSGGSSTNCTTNVVYKVGGTTTPTYTNALSSLTLSTVQSNCATAYTALSTTGQYTGVLSSTGKCTSGTNGSYVLGNWVNWIDSPSEVMTPKITIAKNVITNLINTTKGVKFGVTILGGSHNSSGYGGYGEIFTYNSYTTYVKDMDAIQVNGVTNRTNLINAINSICPSANCAGGAGSPLAAELWEGMRYYQGQTSEISTTNYSGLSPIEAACQPNFSVTISDGMSSYDQDPHLKNICNQGDCDGDNDAAKNTGSSGSYSSDYMDDVAMYMHANDMIGSMPGSKVTVFTIGFGTAGGDPNAVQLLSDTAHNGGGQSFLPTNTQALTQTFLSIISQVIQINSSFVAPVVPVSPSNKTYSGNNLYIGVFLPKNNGFWSGNLKKYNLANGVITDANSNAATDSSGNFLSSSVSYWNSSQDGGQVEVGGVGDLMNNSASVVSSRKLYTYCPSGSSCNSSLTNSSNQFSTGNANLTPAMFGFNSGNGATDTTNKNNLINFVYGYDVFNWGGNGSSAPRGWIMGDVLHSRPVVVDYSSSPTRVIYVGANDGMLHAFNDADGTELWGFIPRDVYPNLSNLYGSTHTYFVDGSPTVYDTGSQKILVFGEHRGGSSYWALDVTNPTSPTFLWKIDSTTTGFTELGQTWSQPQIGNMNIGGTTKSVMIIGGGYDNVHEDALPPTSDTKGRAVYAVDAVTGAKIWEYSYATSVTNDSGNTKDDMTYSIPSDVTILDTTGDGLVDRVYVGDVGGRMWRFDVGDSNTSNWTGKIIFKSNPGNDSSTGRKIFYPPDVTFESGYQFLFFGTGDREHPVSSATIVDRLYAVKDSWVSGSTFPGVITEGSSSTSGSNQLLVDVTSTYTGSLSTTGGWYIKLSTGEKALSPAVVLSKIATFTTFAPISGSSTKTCTANLGTGYVYSLSYTNGNSIYDYNSNGSVDVTADRSKAIGTDGIPSGVVISITANQATGIVGMGGGIVTVQVPNVSQTGQIYWHEPY